MRKCCDSIEVCSHKQFFNYHDALIVLLEAAGFVSFRAQNVVEKNDFTME